MAMFIAAGFALAPAAVARADAAKGLAHYIMGVSYEYEDRLQDAAGEYRAAVTADPSSFPAYLRLGAVSTGAGDAPTAVKALSAALRLKPDELEPRYLLVLAYSAARDFDSAAREYEQVLHVQIARDPQDIKPRFALSHFYYSAGKDAEALAQLEALLQIQPQNTDALLLVGSSYLRGSGRAEGVGLLERCVALDPGYADCLNALGYAYAEDGVSLERAEEMLKRALLVDPDNPAYLDSLGWVYYKEGQFTQALELLDRAQAMEKDPVIFDHIGDVHAKMGSMDLALEAWRRAAALDAAMLDVASKIKQAENTLRKK